jgi:hypothetical protein
MATINCELRESVIGTQALFDEPAFIKLFESEVFPNHYNLIRVNEDLSQHKVLLRCDSAIAAYFG